MTKVFYSGSTESRRSSANSIEVATRARVTVEDKDGRPIHITNLRAKTGLELDKMVSAAIETLAKSYNQHYIFINRERGVERRFDLRTMSWINLN
jgi:hypothetical protein